MEGEIYTIPFWFIDQMTSWLFAEHGVNVIFDYRFAMPEDFFEMNKTKLSALFAVVFSIPSIGLIYCEPNSFFIKHNRQETQ